RISEVQKSIERLAVADEEKALLARVAEARKGYIAARDEARRLRQDGQADAVAAHLRDKVQPAVDAYAGLQRQFVTLQAQRGDALREATGADRMRTAWVVA